MLLHWIWLAHRPGVTDREKARLLRHFQDPEEIFYADHQALRYVEDLSEKALEGLKVKDLRQAERIADACSREKLHILTYRDAAYPAKLRNIADPPAVLYYKGQLPDFDASPVIAVVGTRKASAYGLTTAKRMGYQIARCGGVVVSGMAYGIDGFAMSGALTAGGKTVGVLGCGADIVYPASNRSLFRDVEANGCIISEFQPGAQPSKWSFPKRNRIISGLSNGVLVVEAPERSGALITARLAAEQGRDVFAVPGNIDQPSCVGSNRLLREGAGMVSTGWDILCEYQGLYPDKIRRVNAPSRMTADEEEARQAARAAEDSRGKGKKTEQNPPQEENLKKELDKKAIDKKPDTAYSDVNDNSSSLNREERAIVSSLREGSRLADDVIAETGLTTGRFLATLTMLELKGVIKRLPGKRICLRERR